MSPSLSKNTFFVVVFDVLVLCAIAHLLQNILVNVPKNKTSYFGGKKTWWYYNFGINI